MPTIPCKASCTCGKEVVVTEADFVGCYRWPKVVANRTFSREYEHKCPDPKCGRIVRQSVDTNAEDFEAWKRVPKLVEEAG